MEFCPQCTTILNVEKGSISQDGGNSTDNIGEIIDLIKNNNLNLNNVNIKLNKILKSSEYNELSIEDKELVYNKIQDLLPKYEKKIFEKNIQNTAKLNIFYSCKECNYRSELVPGTLLYTENRVKVYKNIKDYTYMINNPCLPRTDNYKCINESCKSHKGDKMAVIIKDNNNTIYVCTICKNQWII